MTRIIYGLLPVLAAMICLQAPVQAQAIDETDVISLLPGLDIEARIGLGMLASSDEPTAITAFIRNNTNQTIEGRLEISDRWQGSKLNLGEIYLAPGQARRFCAIKNFERWGSPLLAFVSEGKTAWQQPLPWVGYSNNNQQSAHRVAILHDGGTDHQFRVDLPVTKTMTMTQQNSRYGWQDTVDVGFTDAGHPLLTSNVKTWQIPDHFGPLEPVRAIVALDSVDPDKLNAAQKTSIASWIATGGAFYLPVQSEALLKEIERALPFAMSPADVNNTLAVRQCGLGQIVLYPNALFGESTVAAEGTVYRSIAALPRPTVRSAASLELLRRPPSYGRNSTRVSIMGYFFGYLILSVIPIVFVTTKLKRKVLPYTVGLVGIGCLAAAVLGATLRTSTGESRWLTLTVPGENGAVQFADIEVRSTGGIGSTVSISGNQPDLQAESPSPQYSYYYGARNNSGLDFESFDWRANEDDAEDRYQLQSSITPWGTRRLRATDFDSAITAPEVQLDLTIPPKGQRVKGTIRLRNTTEVAIHNVKLVLQQTPGNGNRSQISSQQTVVHMKDLVPDQQIQQPLQFNPTQPALKICLNDTLFDFAWPTSTAPNQVRAFLIGTLDQSPRLKFEDQRSDFFLDHEVHLWVYEIRSDQINIEIP
ncbi:MAG: hypothetical protein ABJZ55_24705 [Fuerstiella sp.]